MKQNLLCLGVFLLLFKTITAQEKLGRPFFTGSTNLTFGINENYTLGANDDETFLKLSAAFLRLGFGYEFRRKIAVSVNGGYDYHWNYAVSAFPAYFSLKYNITENDDDALFTEISYGTMWRFSEKYADGNYYRIGVGIQVAGTKRWNTIIRIDFHRKSILGFKNNRLDSVSLGIGFSFF